MTVCVTDVDETSAGVSHVSVARAARSASTVQPPSGLRLAPERTSQPSLPLQSVSTFLIMLSLAIVFFSKLFYLVGLDIKL